ncbi:MAG: transcriptional regulator [Sterolibacteriaceae bacterium]|uniref:Transcriptional regulator n=1 Tax=Candidatus Methylophosphatis roskildensis TaxID=2899263 RepID=A0A9D7E843_9PROT|nr:transcriptional regulator [Candidatus Methylophosphatis roskildensis]
MKPKYCTRQQEKVKAMLDALADDIGRHPEILRPVPAELVYRIRSLVGGVEVDLDQQLPPETNDAGAR